MPGFGCIEASGAIFFLAHGDVECEFVVEVAVQLIALPERFDSEPELN
jgi:hypothetical protein